MAGDGHRHTDENPQRRDDVIRNWFFFHPATAATGPVHAMIRKTFQETVEILLPLLPEGPDRTLAFRKCQEAMMACNAAVANAQDDDAPALNPHSVDTAP